MKAGCLGIWNLSMHALRAEASQVAIGTKLYMTASRAFLALGACASAMIAEA